MVSSTPNPAKMLNLTRWSQWWETTTATPQATTSASERPAFA